MFMQKKNKDKKQLLNIAKAQHHHSVFVCPSPALEGRCVPKNLVSGDAVDLLEDGGELRISRLLQLPEL